MFGVKENQKGFSLSFSSVIVIGFNGDFHLGDLDLKFSGTFVILKGFGGSEGVFLVEFSGVIGG